MTKNKIVIIVLLVLQVNTYAAYIHGGIGYQKYQNSSNSINEDGSGINFNFGFGWEFLNRFGLGFGGEINRISSVNNQKAKGRGFGINSFFKVSERSIISGTYFLDGSYDDRLGTQFEGRDGFRLDLHYQLFNSENSGLGLFIGYENSEYDEVSSLTLNSNQSFIGQESESVIIGLSFQFGSESWWDILSKAFRP